MTSDENGRKPLPAPQSSTANRGAWWRELVGIPLAVGAAVGLAGGVAWSVSVDSGFEATGTTFVAFDFPRRELDPFSGSRFVTQRIDSYAELGESPEFLQAVADSVPGGSPTGLTGHVDVSAVPGTVLLRVTARDSDRLTAQRIVNSVMSNLDEAVANIEGGSPDAVSPIGLVPVQDAIVGPASSTSANLVRSMVGLAFGSLVGAGVGWLTARRQAGGKHQSRPTEHAVVETRSETGDSLDPASAMAPPELSRR